MNIGEFQLMDWVRQNSGVVIAALLIFSFWVISATGFLSQLELTQSEQVAFFILVTAAVLWITEAVPLFVTSLFVLFLSIVWLAPVMRNDGMEIDSSAFTSPFFSDIIILFLGGFVMSAALNKLRLDEFLARWIIRKMGNSVPNLMVGVMAITAFLSMWLSNTAAAAMMLALIIPIMQGLPQADRYRQCLLLSIAFSANLGGLGTPIGSPPNAIAMQYLTQINMAPSFGMWMLIGVPGVIGMLWIAWGLLIVMFKGESKINIDLEDDLPISFSPELIVVLVTTLLTILGWMTSAIHGFSAGTVALFAVLVLFSARILGVKDLRNLSWDVLLLMGGGLCLGVVLSKSGLASWLIDRLPIEDVPVYWLMVIFGTVACMMSSVMSNTATANLIMPIMLGLNVEPISPLLIGIAFCCSLAMPLPVSTPPNAMAFGSGQLTVKDMVKSGLPITAIGVLLTFTVGYWWWGLVRLW